MADSARGSPASSPSSTPNDVHPDALRLRSGVDPDRLALRRGPALPPGARRRRRRRRLGAGALGAPEAAGARRDPRGRDGPPHGQAVGRRPRGAARAPRGPGAGGDGCTREGGAGMITIDQFRAVELRVGTVRAAEPHPNADRLLVLRVDLGTEERQLVAGIRAHYDPAALVGRQVVVVANLEPAKLRGVESQGMVLAASDGERVVLLRPDDPVVPGAVVR
ncbi:MAG: methionine--tRNA ligase subunit beta [Deltaproteobacteria bacterium]|nr:MAG: methionine--tRNA ligase subunit beta [Deltaproteobacteria bacterium]